MYFHCVHVVVMLLLSLSLQHALIQRNVHVHCEHVSLCVSVSLTLALHDTPHPYSGTNNHFTVTVSYVT